MKKGKYSFRQSHLAATRKNLGLTQQQLADRLEVSRCMISLAEKGTRSLSTTALLKLAALEINQPVEEAKEPAKPVDILSEKRKRSCTLMQIKEMGSRLQAQKLISNLDQFIAEHKRLENWLSKNKEPFETAQRKRQYDAAVKRLARCGPAAQAMVQHEIALHQEKAELYKHMKAELERTAGVNN